MSSDDDTRERLARGRTVSSDPPTDIEELQSVRAHPDPREDLGYDTRDWERISSADDSDQLVFLPDEEEMLLRDAFVIVPESDMQDLRTMR